MDWSTAFNKAGDWARQNYMHNSDANCALGYINSFLEARKYAKAHYQSIAESDHAQFLYILSNLKSWRGPEAREAKEAMRARVKELQKSLNPKEKLAKMPPIYYKMTIDFGGKIVDIGQITKQERAQLQGLRKKGIVIRYDDYTFPRVKNGWFVATTWPGARPARDQALEASLASLNQGAWQYVPEAQLKIRRRLEMQLARNNPAGVQKARTEAEIEQAKRRWDEAAPDRALVKVRLLPRKEERRQARELPLPNPSGYDYSSKAVWTRHKAMGGGYLYFGPLTWSQEKDFTPASIYSNIPGRWSLNMSGDISGPYPTLTAAKRACEGMLEQHHATHRPQNPFIEPIIYGAGLGLGLAGAQIGLKKLLKEKNPSEGRHGQVVKIKPHKALWGSWCHKCHKKIAQGSQMVIYSYQTEGRRPVEHHYHVKCDPGG